MRCPRCQAELRPDARFCPACGTANAPTEANVQPAASEPDLVGRVIGNNFRILAKLGEGGMGAVYRGEQMSLRRQIAIKLLKPDVSQNQMLVRRFNAEAAAVAKLHHPNTVNIIEFGQDRDGTLFIAMELIEGRSLRKVVHHEAPLSPQRALAIAAQIADSIADAHAHDLVHRDLKPDNVMLQDRGRQRDVVRVLDFGIAKLRDDSRATQAAMTQAGDMLGTPQYMAPEQIKGEAIDGRVDIYALGCIIYELVTARQPFEATTVMQMLSKHLMEAPIAPSARRPDLAIPPEIDRLVLTAMMKDPRARPPTMDAYAEAIAQARAALPPDPSVQATGARSAVVGAAAVPTPPAYSAGGAMSGIMQPTPNVMSPNQPLAVMPVAAMTPIPPTQRVAPTQLVTRKSGGGGMKIAMFVIGGVALAGVAVGVGLAMRRSDNPGAHDDKRGDKHDDTPKRPEPDPSMPDPWAVKEHQPSPDEPESPFPVQPAPKFTPAPPAPHVVPRTPTGNAEKVVAIQGVKLHFPSDFSYAWNQGVMVAHNSTMPLLIMAFAINLPANDPKTLDTYVKQTGLTLDGTSTANVAGTTRPAAALHGVLGGQPIAQAVVELAGPSYHIGLSFTVPLAQAQNKQLLTWGDDFLAHHVTLP
ncbi:MAG TPA: protein kinase [Kofleriaceae bacterium]|nr:protein kinase [Kofleriaceae bacterium]